MKKLIALLLAVISVFALCACGSVEQDNGKAAGVVTEDDLNKDFVLKVGFDAEFPPYGYLADNGEYDGYDLAVAKELCDRLGWGFEAVPIKWSAKDKELEAGNINCIWNGFTYTGKEDDYTWSLPYADNDIVIVVKADSGITSLSDLAGKTLMVQASSSAAQAVEDNKEFKASLKEVVELSDYSLGFLDLDNGTVAAVVADYGVAASRINEKSDEYVILSETISHEQYAVGFLKGNTALRDAVNAELLKMAEDGTLLEIAQSSDYVERGLVIDKLILINK